MTTDRLLLLLAFAGTLFAAACVEDTTSEPTREPFYTVATLPDEQIREDEPMLEVARTIPSFGGFYFDKDGTGVVALTDPAAFGAATSALARTLGSKQARGGYRLRAAQYRFIDLARYRTVLSHYVFAIKGVVSLSVNERTNRIEIETVSEAQLGPTEDLIAKLGIPREAVDVLTAVTVSDAVTLEDVLPNGLIEGGWQIANGNQYTVGGLCTLGFPARRLDGTNVFVTASHCTVILNQPDGYPIRQPTRHSGIIGTELLDPQNTCGPTCRNADAALISSDVGMNFARIARTTTSSNCNDCYPGITVAESPNSTFAISDRHNHTYQGEILHKIGRSTGWTYGEVEATCVDYTSSGVKKQCADRIDFFVAGGDSGGPVFALMLDGTAQLRGIVMTQHYNGLTGDYDAYIADLHQIELDLGGLVVSPLMASIAGPDEVPSNTTCVWTADIRGGRGPASVQWYKDFYQVGTSSTLFMNTGTESFVLVLHVTDAWGAEVWQTKNVGVGYGAC